MRKTSKPHPTSRIRDDGNLPKPLCRPFRGDGQVYALDRLEPQPQAKPTLSGRRRHKSESPQPTSRAEHPHDAALADKIGAIPYRDAVCTLCEKVVALAFDMPFECFHQRSRSRADVTLARQIAMYLAHTTFSLLLTEIGLHFHRNRTTVSYACAMIEDRRDDPAFDLLLTQVESLLTEARTVMALNRREFLQQAPRKGGAGPLTKAPPDAHNRLSAFAEPQRRRA
ncbi:MAG: hypothetical protein HRU27_06565 [Rhizobiaceae bacterium]|nr:hypothetical protein [Rhizobiaceae bacterium]